MLEEVGGGHFPGSPVATAPIQPLAWEPPGRQILTQNLKGVPPARPSPGAGPASHPWSDAVSLPHLQIPTEISSLLWGPFYALLEPPLC